MGISNYTSAFNKNKSALKFQNFLSFSAKPFHIKVIKNNLQMSASLVINGRNYIFSMSFFRNGHKIGLCDYTEEEYHVLLNAYRIHIEELARQPIKNSFFIFFLRWFSIKRNDTKIFFSRNIITCSEFSNSLNI